MEEKEKVRGIYKNRFNARLGEKEKEYFIALRKATGLSWNLFIRKIIEDNKDKLNLKIINWSKDKNI